MLLAFMIPLAAVSNTPSPRATSLPVLILILLLMLALSALCFFPHRIDNFFVKRQFVKSPFRGAEYEIKISQEGFAAVSDVDESVTKWPAFSGVVVFDDGLLLCRPGNAANWLPRNAFENNNYEIAIEILSSRFKLQHAT